MGAEDDNSEAVLRARPSFDEGARTYLALLGEIRGILEEEVPDLEWVAEVKAGGRSYCGDPAAGIEADSATFQGGSAKGGIGQEDWARAKPKIVDVAAQYGFTTVNSLVDEPGNVSLAILDDDGASVEVGSKVNTIVMLYGACMLLEK
ncbi:LppA family lipoprotein [Kineosporia succinea]|uniref:LppA-like lipoprotein n=1 Tax=Kineosporia succinea TaxID=84632 RepID=A0ABT9P5E5_9ACTN|nr:LppA family lipoprotein [Kineosporia succinea]MDP9827907.1 hypothetical protein [Kineosporia succinea]